MSKPNNMPPSSVEAEMGILGILLTFSDEFALAADRLQPSHFYREAHRIIYESMLHLFELRQEISVFRLVDYLEGVHKLEQVGGRGYLYELMSKQAIVGTLDELTEMVIKRAVLRKLIEISGTIAAEAWEANDERVEDVVQTAETLIYEVSHQETKTETSSIATEMNEFLTWFDQEDQGGSITGVPTGLDDLDMKTGGWQRSDLIIVAGRPAMGKTSLCMQLARNAAVDYDRNVLVFSLEMSKQQLVKRMAASEARLNVQRVMQRNVTPDERAMVIEKGTELMQSPIFIDDTPAISLSKMRSKIRRMLLKVDIDLIIVDYLQLVQATMDGKRIRDRYQEVSEVARGLKDLAREFNIPVIALAQLSRAVESRADKIPQLSDLKESGEIEQAADIVVFIHRDDYYAGFDRESGKSLSERPKTADLIFAKHRNGPVGECVVGFESSQTRFCNQCDIDIYAYLKEE